MSDIENPTAEKAVSSLKGNLKEMPTDIRLFSLAMRSLYADKAVGTNAETAQRFRKLRDDTRNDAMVYLKGVLPLTTKFVASISEYFEYFEALTLDEWVEMLSDIREETTGFRQLAEAVLKMHEDILVPLKKRQDEAKLLITESKELTEKFDKIVEKLEDAASTKRGWAIGLAFVPVIGAIASPLLSASSPLLSGCSPLDTTEAITNAAQSHIVEDAAIAVSVTLIPALEAFIDGITKAAGFFSVMEQELNKFDGNAEKAVTSPKKLYYKLMKWEAKDMKQICRTFYAVLPAVTTDFQTIPTEGTDQNYVDRWLEQQRKILKEKVTVKNILTGLLRNIHEAPTED